MTVEMEVMRMAVFKCQSGDCTYANWVCDYYNDCPDLSDEFGCGYCRANQFHCDYYACLNASLVCNGAVDCYDATDELGCSCQNFACANGLCVSNSSRCNGLDECRDGSDEDGCGRCSADQFQCKNKMCTNANYVCDYYNDCGDNSDEFGCGYCSPYHFRCDYYECINSSLACNGIQDCPYSNADEEGCRSCNATQFQCQNRQCVDFSRVCDHVADCSDYSDEFGCGTCSSSQFECPLFSGDTCIPSTAVCNGVRDCPYTGFDENICATTPTSAPTTLPPTNTNYTLIQVKLDGVNNCTEWKLSGTTDAVSLHVIQYINAFCSCGITIRIAGLLCFDATSITLRGSVSSNLVGYLQSWITNTRAINIFGATLSVDQNCPVQISSVRDMGCPTAVTTTKPSTTTTGSGQQVALADTVGSAAGAIVGGIVVGVCITIFIVVLIFALRKMKKRTITTPAVRFDNKPSFDQCSVGLETDSSISSKANPSYVIHSFPDTPQADTYAAVRSFPNTSLSTYESHTSSDTARLAKSDALSTTGL
eukprot:Em0010g833a